MGRIACFLVEPSGKVQVKLRRYSTRANNPCPNGLAGYHNALLFLQNEPEELDEKTQSLLNGMKPREPKDHPGWPTQCSCGYQFQPEDAWDRFIDRIYRRSDTGEEYPRRDIPPGGMWFEPWLDGLFKAQLEHCITVMTPGGEWQIDSQARNCTIPEDHRQQRHHCWVITGTPPLITAGKGGITCSAGAGSIQCGAYHGFLREGYLED